MTLSARLTDLIRHQPECDRETLREAAAELARLRAIVDRLPKTADGVPVTPGMELFTRHDLRSDVVRLVPHGTAILDDEMILSWWYSTREAAAAARRAT